MTSLETGKHLFIFIYLFIYFFYLYLFTCNFVLLKLIFHYGKIIDAGQPVGVKMHSEILENIKIS